MVLRGLLGGPDSEGETMSCGRLRRLADSMSREHCPAEERHGN